MLAMVVVVLAGAPGSGSGYQMPGVRTSTTVATLRNWILRNWSPVSVPAAKKSSPPDVALVISVMRLANKRPEARGRIRSVPQAIEVLTPAGVEALIGSTKTFDFFERTPIWDAAPERFRLHAVATQRAADRLSLRVDFPTATSS